MTVAVSMKLLPKQLVPVLALRPVSVAVTSESVVSAVWVKRLPDDRADPEALPGTGEKNSAAKQSECCPFFWKLSCWPPRDVLALRQGLLRVA